MTKRVDIVAQEDSKELRGSVGMKWEESTLYDLGTLNRGKSKHRPRDAEHLYGGAYPFIQTGDVKQAPFYIKDYSQTYSDAGLAQSKLWPRGTLCITIAANIAETAILDIDACFPDSIIGFTPDPKKSDVRFVKYLIDHQKKRLCQISQGTTQDNLSGEKLLKLKFPVPPLSVQKKIADILSAYDDLIEVNRRSIQLLEDSARRIYKEWFVQFRFPDHEKVKMVDGLPDGWKRVPYGEISIEIRDSVDPKDIDPTTPYLGLEHLPRKSITLSDWDYPDKVESHKFRFLKDDILFGKIRPYFHKVGFGLTDGITSSDAVVIRAKNKELQTLLLLCTSSDDFVAFATQTSKEGSKMPRADWDKIRKDFLVNLPSQDIVGLFNQTINPMLAQLRNLALEARSLSEARDRILPRLMSGKIDLGA